MEKDEKPSSLDRTLFAMLLFILSTVSCTPLLIGQAAFQGARIVATGAAMEDRDELKDSVKAFNEAFRFEDYARASVFASREKKKNSGPRWTGFKEKSESWNMS